MQSRNTYELLERKYQQFNSSSFIESDPISVPHRFSKTQDIEIIGFWIAMLAWGTENQLLHRATNWRS